MSIVEILQLPGSVKDAIRQNELVFFYRFRFRIGGLEYLVDFFQRTTPRFDEAGVYVNIRNTNK